MENMYSCMLQFLISIKPLEKTGCKASLCFFFYKYIMSTMCHILRFPYRRVFGVLGVSSFMKF